MSTEEAILLLEHICYDDFNLLDHQIKGRLEAIEVILKENQELKKQYKELKTTNNVLTNELTKDTIIKQGYLTTCCGIPIGDIPKLKSQQKEFIEYLEEPIKLIKQGNPVNITEYTSAKLDILEEILAKYKEITGIK